MSAKLKPCPFCGGEGEITTITSPHNTVWYSVRCKECLAMALDSTVDFVAEENWNRRVEVDK